MKTELLAPAKDKFTAFDAINCGADAVYIGASAFGARKNASNTLEDIKEVVDYAHKFWAKVFVTMNTILTDSELEEAFLMAKELETIGVDALIIQDMGLLEKFIQMDNEKKVSNLPQNLPQNLPLPLHMSTQCDNYLPQKIKFFNEIGVSRVVLARETSLKEIAKIHEENPNLELEGFVHGALCVSMSGQCYLSQYIGGRSANRGVCAQPCRKKYSVETDEGKVLAKDIYALCLKDFNASNLLEELRDAGVFSFKIEGRLKDSNYVKNIVAYYRQKLGKGISSGKSFYAFEPNPEKSFNRGFTEYFLKERTNCFNFNSPKSKGEYLGSVVEVKADCFKIKTNKLVNSQDGLYYNGEGCLVNRVENGYIYPNKKLNLKVNDKVFRNSDSEFEKILSKPVKRQIGINILIDRDFITVTDEDDVTVSCKFPVGEKANNPTKMQETFIKQFSKTGESDFYINDIKVTAELPFLPVSEINNLRRNLLDKLMQARLEKYNLEIKQKRGKLKYANYYLKEVDYRANVHNKYARKFYENCGVNVLETSFELNPHAGERTLMRCKHCIKYALNICKKPINLLLRDEYDNKYPLKFDCKNCQMLVMAPEK